jgi:2-polyprenyl-3-methyl-5-hydroxy-6-metoxy-1,4-benzoquinol methylase
MNRDALVKALGFPATLVHGDTMVLDRWLFLKRHLVQVRGESRRVVEIGCGSGAFTIGAALRGYSALGLSWDSAAQESAARRALLCRAQTAAFRVSDARSLEELRELYDACDAVICCETIEHIINDSKLMTDMARCLKAGGKLLLTSPYLHYKPMGGDEGPFVEVEDGRHVRRGYTHRDLERLCVSAGLKVAEAGYCSGLLSQKGTKAYRFLSSIHPLIAWALLMPYRLLPPMLDRMLGAITGWPGYSVTLVAMKP